MRRRQWLALIPLFALACTARREPKFDYGEPKQRYALRGKVLRLRPEARVASIDHEKIEGWMEAMTMEFPVPKEEDFTKLLGRSDIEALASELINLFLILRHLLREIAGKAREYRLVDLDACALHFREHGNERAF